MKDIAVLETADQAAAAEEKRQMLRRRRMRAYVRKYLLLFIGAIITAVGLEIFLVPNNIIDGGVVGISIMLSAITDYPLGMFILLLNLPFILIQRYNRQRIMRILAAKK